MSIRSGARIWVEGKIYIYIYVYMTHNFAYHEYIVFETNLKNEKLFI